MERSETRHRKRACRGWPPPGGAARFQTPQAASIPSATNISTMAGKAWNLEPFKTEVREETAKTIMATTTRPTSPSTGRSILIAGASMAASIAMLAQATPIGGIRRASIRDEADSEGECGRGAGTGAVEARLFSRDDHDRQQHGRLSALERERKLTRGILEVLDRFSHPVAIVTKSALRLRDIDILARLASRGLTRVALSVTTLNRRLARRVEPRASTPARLASEAIRRLSAAGVPMAVMAAPLIPALNDSELERILKAAADAGATEAAYVLLRLPLEISPLFQEWLKAEFPGRAKHIISLVRSMRGGKDYVSCFGERQRGAGPYADQIAARFELALKRYGLNQEIQSAPRSLPQAASGSAYLILTGGLPPGEARLFRRWRAVAATHLPQ